MRGNEDMNRSWDESHSWVWKTATDLTPNTISDELRSCEVVSRSELQTLITQNTFKT